MSFRDYAEIALYHPEQGYYSSPSVRYHRRGDFLTAPSASSWYAEVVAALLGRIAARSGPFVLLDVGAGDGRFVAEVVRAAARLPGGAVREVVAVERSAAMRERLAARAAHLAAPVTCLERASELDPLRGPVAIHAAELFDALPMHRVVMRGRSLRELWVVIEGEALAWQERPAPEELGSYFAEHGVTLQDGQLAEANLGARALHRELLDRAGGNALLLVLDYGYPAPQLFDPRARRGGSLAGYRNHRLSRDPLAAPGQQDITAHVNWDDLRAATGGWQEVGLWPLAEFLVRAGLERVMECAGIGPDAELDSHTFGERQEIKRLLDPDGMGSDLKVLVQATGQMVAPVREILCREL